MGTASDNRQLLEGVFSELSRGNTRAMSEAMSDDVRWVFPGAWAWSGVWEPKRRVLGELLEPLMQQFSGTYRSEAELIVAEGDRVVVQARGHARTVRGDPYEQTYCYVFTLAGGRIREVIEHCDTALVERVLQPPARA